MIRKNRQKGLKHQKTICLIAALHIKSLKVKKNKETKTTTIKLLKDCVI